MVKIMTDKKRNVPQLRFRGFTETWEQRSLGDYADLKGRIGFRGYTRNDIIPKEKGGILTFSPTNIINGQINNNSKNTYITELKYNESPEIKVKNNDILFVKTGSTLGKSSLVENLQEPATINPQIVIIKSKVGNEHFLAIYLQTAQLLRQVHALKIGGAVPTLTEAEIKTFTINIPKAKAEASQISALFNRLDKLIALHQRKQNQFKKVKKALLQKMFADEKNPFPFIRFKGFTEAWEQRKLKDTANFAKGIGYSKKDLKSSGIPIILYGRLYTKYETVINEIDTFTQPKKDTFLSKGGEIIVPASGETAEDISVASVVKNKGIILGGDLNIVYPNSSLNSVFLALNITYGRAHDEMRRRAQGKTIVHLHNSDLANIKLKIPTISEQKKIVYLLEKINKLIALHQRKLDQLQKLKKSLLQNMFI